MFVLNFVCWSESLVRHAVSWSRSSLLFIQKMWILLLGSIWPDYSDEAWMNSDFNRPMTLLIFALANSRTIFSNYSRLQIPFFWLVENNSLGKFSSQFFFFFRVLVFLLLWAKPSVTIISLRIKAYQKSRSNNSLVDNKNPGVVFLPHKFFIPFLDFHSLKCSRTSDSLTSRFYMQELKRRMGSEDKRKK